MDDKGEGGSSNADGLVKDPLMRGCSNADGLVKDPLIGKGEKVDLEMRGKSAVETTDVDSKKVPDWRNLFSTTQDQALRYFPPQVSDGKKVVSPPNDIFEKGVDQWRNSVVAQFIGKIPNFSIFQKLVNILWRADGAVDVRPAGPNLFIIQLPNEKTRDRVLESGPWHIQHRPLFVRKWEPGLKSLEFNMERLPIWVHLGNVPLELFTVEGLSYIASAIGNPLYMDKFTASRSRLAFAKICVEMEAASTIPRFIDVKMRDGSYVSVSVDVPWFPHKCSKCSIFGHTDKVCTKKAEIPVKAWVAKNPEAKVESSKQDVDSEVTILPSQENGSNSPLRAEVEKLVEKRNDSISSLKVVSVNKFAVLSSLNEKVENVGENHVPSLVEDNTPEMNKEDLLLGSRRPRTASAGVAELMRNLKTKRKGPFDKGKSKGVKVVNSTLRGTSNPSL